MRSLIKGLLLFAVLAAPFVGGSLWLDAHGEIATATVTGKREQITFLRDPFGSWRRDLQLEAGFTAPGSQLPGALVTVDPARFDSLRNGDRVQVRYLSCCPIFARLADRSTADAARDAAAKLVDSNWIPWLAAGAIGLFVAARMGTVPVLAVGLLWLAAAVPLFFQPPAPPVIPRGAEATAQVEWTSVVNRSPSGSGSGRRRRSGRRWRRYLPAPYQVVQLRFLPAGSTESVLAADAVDSGSVPGLAHLAKLRVQYDPSAPREARLVQGTRTFVERNRYHNLIPVVGAVGLGVLLALGWRAKRRGEGRVFGRARAAKRGAVGHVVPP